MDIPKPVIPLDIALTVEGLRSFLHDAAEKRVTVFGTAHSGTLILKNLKDLGCRQVTAIYKGRQPFRWARYHDPEGLKQESALIADDIVGRAWGELTPTLVHVDDIAGTIRAVMSADFVIYALGFESRRPTIVGIGGTVLHPTFHPDTAELAPGLWGFGIGFPGLYELPKGGKAADVGFGGFVAQIQRCMGGILH